MESGLAQLAVATTAGARIAGSIMRDSDRSKGEKTGNNGQSAACELCLREAERYTVHHLVPRAKGGRFGPKAKLCPTCHRQLHALFYEATLAKELHSIDYEATLAKELHSIDLIRANPQMSEYLRWARRQKGPTSFRVRRAKARR